jgi:hypothetical protein
MSRSAHIKKLHQKTSWASSQLNSLHAKPQTLDDAETPRGNVVYRALFSSQSRAQSAQSEPCMDETGLSGRCRESGGIQALLARPVNSVSGVRPRCSDFGPPASTPCLARMHGVLSLTLWQLARLAGHRQMLQMLQMLGAGRARASRTQILPSSKRLLPCESREGSVGLAGRKCNGVH